MISISIERDGIKNTILNNIDLVIFDMDGLLLDTEKIAIDSWIRASNEYGYHLDRDLAITRIGTSKNTRDDFYDKHFGIDYPRENINKLREKYFLSAIRSGTLIIKEGVLDLLEQLDRLGIKKAVATSTFKERAMELLNRNNIYNRFDYILCGDEIKSPKPNPEIYKRVCKEFSVPVNRVLVLEDSDIGSMAAYNAGIKYILVKDLKPPTVEAIKNACLVVDSIRELMINK